MATYQKRGSAWRVIVRKQGVNKSRTFHTKARAVAWATKLESEILDGSHGNVADKTLGDLLTRYESSVSRHKKGHRWEKARIGLFLRDPAAQIKLGDLSASVMAEWRDRRLESVSPASVNREWNLLNHALNMAINEWEWLSANPLMNIKRPPHARHRERLYTDGEIERIVFASGYDDVSAVSVSERVGAAFLFAIETGMRAGEIASLRKVNLKTRVARLEETKNGHPRDVPLSSQAVDIIGALPEGHFNLTSMQISSVFKKIRKMSLIEDATFHDTRHTAITRLAKKLDVLDLARMVGIRDLKILMVYYNESAESIAKRLS